MLCGLPLRQLEQTDPAIGAGNAELPPRVVDVGRRGFERVGGEGLPFVERLAAGHNDRRAADKRRARADAADAVHLVGVALDDPDTRPIELEHLGDELNVGGLHALTHGLRTRENRDRTVGADPHIGGLGEECPGPFEVAREAAATQLPALRRVRFASRVTVPVRALEQLVQDLRVFARVVDLAHRGPVGHRVGRDEVPPPYFDRPETGRPAGLLHQALHEENRLRPAGAAISAGRHRVGDHAADVEVDDRHAVDRGHDLGPEHQRNHRGRPDCMAAEVCEHARAQGEDSALRVERERGSEVLVAAHVCGEKVLAAIGAPAHRAGELLRRVRDQRILRHEAGLHAEAAADLADHDAEKVRLRTERGAEQIASTRGLLGLGIERGASVLVHGDRRPRLERECHQPLVVQADLDDVRRLPDGRVDRSGIAVACLGRDVAGRVLPKLRRVRRERIVRVDHGGERVVIDGDQLGCILCLAPRRRDHGGHRLPRIAYGVVGQRVARGDRHRRAVAALEERWIGDRADAVGLEVRHRPHRKRARRACGGAGVDRNETRMGMRRPNDDEPDLAGERAIVAVEAPTHDEPGVFDAFLGAGGAEAGGLGVELKCGEIHLGGSLERDG